MTDGGEGCSGTTVSEETRIKMNENNVGMSGKKHSDNTKEIMSSTRKNKFETGELNLKGENHNLSKLKNEEVWLIKKILDSDYYKSGKITQKFIGKMFGVSYKTVSAIKK